MKIVLISIADHANQDGYARPGHKRLADHASVSERQVRRLIDQAHAEGRLQKIHGHGPGRPQGYQFDTEDIEVSGVRRGSADIQVSGVDSESPDISTGNTGHSDAEQRTFGDGTQYREEKEEIKKGPKNKKCGTCSGSMFVVTERDPFSWIATKTEPCPECSPKG